MKLTAKIILIYLLAIALLTVVHGYSIVRREDQQLKHENEEEAHSIAVTMEREVIVTWKTQGNEGVGRMINHADDQHEEWAIRWIALNVSQPNANIATSIQQLKTADQGRTLTIVSQKHQRMYYPIDVANERAGCLEFSQPLADVNQYTRGTVYHTSSLILGMLLVGGVVSLLGIRLVGTRLDQLIEKTQRIGQSDFTEPLRLGGNDELNLLASALNDMSDKLNDQQGKIIAESTARLAAVEQLRHVDRLNTVGRLASGVAHELGTPLNVVSGRAELIASGRLDDDQNRESALTIKSEAERMTGIIRQLLDFARRRTPQRKPVDLVHVTNQCVELLRPLAGKQNVELVVRGNESLIANVDAAQMQQVLTNLVVNAIQAMPAGGTVSIGLEQRRARQPGMEGSAEETYCCISVADEGEGINDDDREGLFEPFFTTKDVGEGTGLGLSVSYGIVQDHDGWIDVQSEPGTGSCFTVFLPTTC